MTAPKTGVKIAAGLAKMLDAVITKKDELENKAAEKEVEALQAEEEYEDAREEAKERGINSAQ